MTDANELEGGESRDFLSAVALLCECPTMG